MKLPTVRQTMYVVLVGSVFTVGVYAGMMHAMLVAARLSADVLVDENGQLRWKNEALQREIQAKTFRDARAAARRAPSAASASSASTGASAP